MEKLYILDSTVFLETETGFLAGKACATVYDVAEEMKSTKASIEFDKMVRLGLEIIEPEKTYIDEAEKTAKSTNDKVSCADKKVVALALHFKAKGKDVAVVSDDYGVQNLCKHLNLEIVPQSQKAIRQKLTWLKKCSACGKRVESFEDICPVCGSPLKYVPKR
ncbi:MAG: hypothetical protein ABIG84_02330 [archaeon]